MKIIKTIQTDLLVVGGGLAGIFAAIAAKRTNPNIIVWLVERYGFLGGMATAGYVYPFMSYFTKMPDNKGWKRLSGGLFQELLDDLHKLGYCERKARISDFYQRFDPMLLRCVLDQKVEKEGINILFHGLMNDLEYSEHQKENQSKKIISKIFIQTKSGAIEFIPKFIIDATGDADVVFHAGGTTFLGRDVDGLTQPATLNFRMGNINKIAFQRPKITKLILKEKLKGNPLTNRDDCLKFYGNNHQEEHFNQTRVAGYDFTDPFEMTAAEIEGRKQAERFIRFLRRKVLGYKHSQVMSMGSQLGIRETRRIEGEYCLSEDDLLSQKQFDDRIALGNYSIDIHDPKGSGKTDIRHIPKGKWYSIPYRSLIPKGISNVLVAGRPISTTHVAHSAIRVMSITSCIGHAAGVAAGILISEINPVDNIDLDFTCVDVNKVQTELRKQHAILE